MIDINKLTNNEKASLLEFLTQWEINERTKTQHKDREKLKGDLEKKLSKYQAKLDKLREKIKTTAAIKPKTIEFKFTVLSMNEYCDCDISCEVTGVKTNESQRKDACNVLLESCIFNNMYKGIMIKITNLYNEIESLEYNIDTIQEELEEL